MKTRGDCHVTLDGLAPGRVDAGRRPRRWLFSAVPTPLLLCLVAVTAPAGEPRVGSRLHAAAHPNHYIILVDASGSTGGTPAREQAFRNALFTVMLPRLYHHGYGPQIPPFDSDRDVLSLHHFGVVSGNAQNAYRQLEKHDLLSQYVHSAFVRRGHVRESVLRPHLFPGQRYNLTLMSWAKPLALWASRTRSVRAVSHRTFMVIVTDEIPNAATLAQESDQMMRWARKRDAREIAGILAEVSDRYVFSDGNGGARWAWQQTITPGDGSTPFFVEVYEITPVRQRAWQQQGERIEPLLGPRVTWAMFGLPPTRALVATELRPDFLRWLASARGVTGEIGVQIGRTVTNAPWSGTSHWRLTIAQPDTAGHARNMRISVQLELTQDDPWLGTSTVHYTYSTPLVVPPLPLYQAVQLLVVLIVVSAASWLAYHRFVATHFYAELPGSVEIVPLPRIGSVTKTARVTPSTRSLALTLRVPPVWIQWLLYRGSTLSVRSSGAPVAWVVDTEWLSTVRLPARAKQYQAVWTADSDGPTTVELDVRHRKGQAAMSVKYAEQSASRRDASHKRVWDYYVALDLGSETMAAYYRPVSSPAGRGGMVHLQAHARLFVAESRGKPALVMDGRAVSPRLRTRFELQGRRQPRCLPVEHAFLDFVSSDPGRPSRLPGYEASLIRYFFGEREERGILNPNLVPNPKVVFQLGALPGTLMVEASGTTPEHVQYVELTAEKLIHHMSAQVVRNFILRSPQLAGVPGNRIHLTLTIPNVYSLAHAQSIREFLTRYLVEERKEVGEVAVLYESDAIAYYALDRHYREPALRLWRQCCDRIGAGGSFRLVTVDVGRGTTDLSMIEVSRPAPRPRDAPASGQLPPSGVPQIRHVVLARTGRSDGGNRLSHILAAHYDRMFRKAFTQSGNLVGVTQAPFSLLSLSPGEPAPLPQQADALLHLEALIERVKAHFTEDYQARLPIPEQRELVRPLVERVLESFGGVAQKDQTEFSERLVQALLLPLARSGYIRVLGLLARLARLLPRNRLADWLTAQQRREESLAYGPTPDELAQLRTDIENYVEDTVGLIDELGEMAASRGGRTAEAGPARLAKVFGAGATFVVVAGQASQFAPLRRAISEAFAAYGVSDETHVGWLTGSRAKEACCMGAVSFQFSGHRIENEAELHGTYGMWKEIIPSEFVPANMTTINAGATDVIRLSAAAGCAFVYTTRTLANRRTDFGLEDGMTAYLRGFTGDRFAVRYDRDRARLVVDEVPVSLATFGDLGENMWPRLWPERLPPSL